MRMGGSGEYDPNAEMRSNRWPPADWPMVFNFLNRCAGRLHDQAQPPEDL